MVASIKFYNTSIFFFNFECWFNAESSKKLRRGLCFIWNASIWVIWWRRNDIIFNNGVVEVEDLVDSIKVLSWY